eukprot:6530762-Lingulodinium_polyedra.AAC.1
MNQDANEATKYVKDVIAQFTENPDSDDFDPVYLQKFPLEGSTAPTFIGAMQYVRTSEDLNDDLCFSVNHSNLNEGAVPQLLVCLLDCLIALFAWRRWVACGWVPRLEPARAQSGVALRSGHICPTMC